jgi:hypothetical protein
VTPREGPAPEAGCNCFHLADDARCRLCGLKHESGPTLIEAVNLDREWSHESNQEPNQEGAL